MKRHDTWPALLTTFIEERRALGFIWGANDCCLFAADWVRMATGQDFADGIRGRYFSALGAARVLKQYGGVVGLTERHAGLQRGTLTTAQRGDLLAHQMPGGLALGICLGAVGAYVGRDGIKFAPAADAAAVWKV